MKMLFLQILILFLCLPILFAQHKNDNIWLLGYTNEDTSTVLGGFSMEFTEESFMISTLKYNIGGVAVSNASICDDTGNLQVYSNGCFIANQKHEVIENGDDINPGDIHEEWCEAIGSYLSSGSTTILPIPEHPDEYIYFYERFNEDLYTDGLLYAYIDMNQNDGDGKVIQKNEVLLEDTLFVYITAVRHGNGRDWWLVVPSGSPSRDFNLFLLSPVGLEGPFFRSYPPASEPPFGTEYSFGGPTQAVFTPDGSKYCRVNRLYGIEIYDFDRCTGEFSIRKKLPLPPLTEEAIRQNDTTLLNLDVGGAGMAASPNSRYLYVSNLRELYQIDLCDQQYQMQLIDTYNGALKPLFPASFFQMQLAPDGKIYMSSGSTVNVLSVIQDPDKPGKLCDFAQHGVALPRYTGFVLPNFPHFRLLDLPGSPCDSLGIDAPPKEGPAYPAFTLFPNPARNEVHLFIPDCKDARLEIFNAAGQFLYQSPRLTGEASYDLDITLWPSGVYFVVFTNGDGGVATQKLVIAR